MNMRTDRPNEGERERPGPFVWSREGEEQEGKGFPVSQAAEIKTERRENGRLAQALQNFGRMAARYALECQLEGLHSQLHFPVFLRITEPEIITVPFLPFSGLRGRAAAAELSEAKSS